MATDHCNDRTAALAITRTPLNWSFSTSLRASPESVNLNVSNGPRRPRVDTTTDDTAGGGGRPRRRSLCSSPVCSTSLLVRCSVYSSLTANRPRSLSARSGSSCSSGSSRAVAHAATPDTPLGWVETFTRSSSCSSQRDLHRDRLLAAQPDCRLQTQSIAALRNPPLFRHLPIHPPSAAPVSCPHLAV